MTVDGLTTLSNACLKARGASLVPNSRAVASSRSCRSTPEMTFFRFFAGIRKDFLTFRGFCPACSH